MKLLATTALEETWGKDESLVFLGDWCKLSARTSVWTPREYKTVPYHWDERGKVRKDHDKLLEFHERVVAGLTPVLNAYHQVHYPLRYWRIMLDPWLVSYVAILFDRWECLRLAFEKFGSMKTIRDTSFGRTLPFDYKGATTLSQSDSWNHQLCCDIIDFQYSDQCQFIDTESISTDHSNGSKICFFTRDLGFRGKVVRFLDRLLDLAPLENKVVFHTSYFRFWSLMKICLKLGQLPRMYVDEFSWPPQLSEEEQIELLSSDRSSFSLEMPTECEFETYFVRRIAQDIPIILMEGYGGLKQRASTINLRPKMIFSAGSHWSNELFKIWMAERVCEGSKFFGMQHGGSINLGTLSRMYFEEDISDAYITWGKETHPKHIRLPASKLCDTKKLQPGESCSLIGLEMTRYVVRVQATPLAGQTLEHYRQTIELYRNLSDEVQLSFKVRPYPDRGWSLQQRYIEDIGEDKISPIKDFASFLASSRIIICSYPQTTFSESLLSGIPTILFYPKELFELHENYHDLVNALLEAKIIFHCPKLAALHINSIWRDPQHWWGSEEVMKARRLFQDQSVLIKKNWVQEWVNFIKAQSATD